MKFYTAGDSLMTINTDDLPGQNDRIFLTDSGLETTFIFLDGMDLPEFAAFTLLNTESGREHLRTYYRRHADIARELGAGFIFESATWRSSPDWGAKLGYAAEDLAQANRAAIEIMKEVARDYIDSGMPMVFSGCVGPRGDGYKPEDIMSVEEARRYHTVAIREFKDAGADLITGITMTNIPEAIGVSQAATDVGLPAVISFTVETDGRLPAGETLAEAIAAIDAQADPAPLYYMINCAHPDHFAEALPENADWVARIRGFRANASRMSHAELDDAEELDDGDPVELGQLHHSLLERLPGIIVLGGCCGTDHRHIRQIGEACLR